MTKDFTAADSRLWGAISFGFGILVSLPFHSPRSTAVALAVGMLIFTTRTFWELNLQPLFWASLLLFAVLHGLAVFLLPFSEPKIPIIAILMPLAFLDYFLMASWLERLKKRLLPSDG